MSQVATIALDDIRPNPMKLREVDTDSEAFNGLVESIRDTGVLNAISVRRKKDVEDGSEHLELVDGFHRYTASKFAGLEEINVTILDIDAEGAEGEKQVLLAQIMANVHKIETKPVEYAKQLLRIISEFPMMAMSEIAASCNKGTAWVTQQLKLNRIKDKAIQDLVDNGSIKLLSAYALSSLPPEDQAELVDSAMVEDVKSFTAIVDARKKENKEAGKAGRASAPIEFVPRPRLRGIKDLDATRQDAGKIQQLITESNASSAEEGFILALDFMRHMDPCTLSQEQKDWESKQKLKEERKIAKQQAAAEKKATAAAKKAEELAKAAAEVGAEAQINAEG